MGFNKAIGMGVLVVVKCWRVCEMTPYIVKRHCTGIFMLCSSYAMELEHRIARMKDWKRRLFNKID